MVRLLTVTWTERQTMGRESDNGQTRQTMDRETDNGQKDRQWTEGQTMDRPMDLDRPDNGHLWTDQWTEKQLPMDYLCDRLWLPTERWLQWTERWTYGYLGQAIGYQTDTYGPMRDRPMDREMVTYGQRDRQWTDETPMVTYGQTMDTYETDLWLPMRQTMVTRWPDLWLPTELPMVTYGQ